MKRILSLRGGGMRVYCTACALCDLEQSLGKPLYQVFDLVAGTSAGAIVSACIALGISAENIIQFFEVEGPKIFAAKTFRGIRARLLYPQFETENLLNALSKHFGICTMMSKCKTNLMMLATRKEAKRAKFWKSWQDPEMPVYIATATSAAAPTFFRSVEWNCFHWCDGGVWGNNPVVYASIEAKRLWPGEEITALDLACPDVIDDTMAGAGVRKRFVHHLQSDEGALGVASEFVGLCISSGENASSEAARLIADSIYVFEPSLHNASPDIADASPSNLEALKACYLYDRETTLPEMLKHIVPSV